MARMFLTAILLAAAVTTGWAADDSLEVVSTTPASPARLKPKERLKIAIAYTLDSVDEAIIDAYARTKGKKTDGYTIPFDSLAKRGKGELVRWVSFSRDTEVDEIRVHMFDPKTGKVLKSVSRPIQAMWK